MASSHTWDRVHPYFVPEEFDHPEQLSDDLVLRLWLARRFARMPFHVKSDYREGDRLAHGRGTAVDFGLSAEPAIISGRQRREVYRALDDAGFTRIGLYDRHFHVDVDTKLPQEVLWIGKSQ